MNAIPYTLLFTFLLLNVIYADSTIGIRGGGGHRESNAHTLDQIQKQQHFEHHNYDYPDRRDHVDWGGYGDGYDEIDVNPNIDDDEEEDDNDDDSNDNDEDNEEIK